MWHRGKCFACYTQLVNIQGHSHACCLWHLALLEMVPGQGRQPLTQLNARMGLPHPNTGVDQLASDEIMLVFRKCGPVWIYIAVLALGECGGGGHILKNPEKLKSLEFSEYSLGS